MAKLLHHNESLLNSAESLLQKFPKMPSSLDLTCPHADMDELIFLEPFCLKKQYFSYYGIWVDYLKSRRLENKVCLKVMGIAPSSPCPNYLDLLNPDIDAFLSANHACPEDQEHKIHPYYHFNGIDIRLPIKRLLKGHGTHLFYQPFQVINRKFNLAIQSLSEGKSYASIRDGLLKDIDVDQVILLQARWQQYAPYFAYLPFSWQISQYEDLLQDLLYFIGEGAYEQDFFENSMLYSRLSNVFGILEDLRNMYLSN